MDLFTYREYQAFLISQRLWPETPDAEHPAEELPCLDCGATTAFSHKPDCSTVEQPDTCAVCGVLLLRGLSSRLQCSRCLTIATPEMWQRMREDHEKARLWDDRFLQPHTFIIKSDYDKLLASERIAERAKRERDNFNKVGQYSGNWSHEAVWQLVRNIVSGRRGE